MYTYWKQSLLKIPTEAYSPFFQRNGFTCILLPKSYILFQYFSFVAPTLNGHLAWNRPFITIIKTKI